MLEVATAGWNGTVCFGTSAGDGFKGDVVEMSLGSEI